MNSQLQPLNTWAVAGLAVRYNVIFFWRVTIFCLKIVTAFVLGAFFNVRLNNLALPKPSLSKIKKGSDNQDNSDQDEVLEGEIIDVDGSEHQLFHFNASHTNQQTFLRKIGLKSDDQQLWLISNDTGLVPAIALNFKDPLFQWKKAVLKKLGYAWSHEMKLWQIQ